MQNVKNIAEKAHKHITIADHILTQTYPLVNDPKLLLGVIEKLHKANIAIIDMILSSERVYKRIPPYHDNDESKINMFKLKTVKHYNINIEYIKLVEDVREILLKHKKSPVEFVRKDRFVICTDNYRMRTISVKQMKNYIKISKIFLQDMVNLVNRNG